MKKLLIFSSVLFLGVLLAQQMRYQITGTNKGYMYKTDKFTGRTFLVTPNGEVDVKTLAPTQVKLFPVGMLEVVSSTGVTGSPYPGLNVVVKNNSAVDAKNIVFKINYSDTKDGEPTDTEYSNHTLIRAGDTETVYITLFKASSRKGQYWYTVSIPSAEQ